ncbi:MAG: hypothetical protein K9N07_08580 [Candidatus Cloacimonetes bacterium]|nr:hypothetical protein [Candidatus Cloacimonadota bacterium]
MKLKKLMQSAKIPILIIGIIITVFSVFSYFFSFQITLNKHISLLTNLVYNIFYQLDFCKEHNIASLFMSFMFLLLAHGFFILSTADNEKLKLAPQKRGLAKLISIILLYLAVDEVLNVKIILGNYIENITGVFNNSFAHGQDLAWLILYIPVASLGLMIFNSVISKLVKSIKTKKRKRLAGRYFRTTIIFIIAYFSLMMLAIYIALLDQPIVIFFYLTEFVKLISIISASSLLLKISENYNI